MQVQVQQHPIHYTVLGPDRKVLADGILFPKELNKFLVMERALGNTVHINLLNTIHRLH